MITFKENHIVRLLTEDYKSVSFLFKDIKIEGFKRFCINPLINLNKWDENHVFCKALMFEWDNKNLNEQFELMTFPYSYAIFTGNKSIHFIVDFYETLNLEEYKFLYKWACNCLGNGIDLQNNSPVKTSRIPNTINSKTGKLSKLIEGRGKIHIDEFLKILRTFPKDKIPEIYKKEELPKLTNKNPMFLQPWLLYQLNFGAYEGKRNKFFCQLGIDLKRCGFTIEEALSFFYQKSVNQYDKDFSPTELENTFRWAYRRH